MATLTLGLLGNKQNFKDFEIPEKAHYFLTQKEEECADLNVHIRSELKRSENGTPLKFFNKKVCDEILSWVNSCKKKEPLLDLWVWSF